ncbi:MAG: hypothetical protein L6420_06110 [Elusimicrobia bacterium]|nr:hypothetical protein [Elusimicrobiota bacterium]
MKKIGIVVFSLMFLGVAYVGAQDVQVSFDGEYAVQNTQNIENFLMPEAFSDIEYNIPVPKREVKYYEDEEGILVSKKTEDLYSIDTQWRRSDYIPILSESYLYESMDQTTIKRLTGYFMAQNELRKIILDYFKTYDNSSSNIFHIAQDTKTIILYNNESVHLINGKKLFITKDKELVKKMRSYSNNQTMKIWSFVGQTAWGVVVGCAVNADCREDVMDYVTQLEDDENDTYHNHQDDSNPNYEVYKMIK